MRPGSRRSRAPWQAERSTCAETAVARFSNVVRSKRLEQITIEQLVAINPGFQHGGFVGVIGIENDHVVARPYKAGVLEAPESCHFGERTSATRPQAV